MSLGRTIAAAGLAVVLAAALVGELGAASRDGAPAVTREVVVPPYDGLDPASYADRLHAAGLVAEPVDLRLPGEPAPTHVVGIAPRVGATVEAGSSVRVLERDPDERDTVRLGYDGFDGRRVVFAVDSMHAQVDVPVGGVFDYSDPDDPAVDVSGPVDRIGAHSWRVTGPGVAELLSYLTCSGSPPCTPVARAHVFMRVGRVAPTPIPAPPLSDELSLGFGPPYAAMRSREHLGNLTTIHLRVGEVLRLRLSDQEGRALAVDQEGASLSRNGIDWRAVRPGTTILTATTSTCSPVLTACHAGRSPLGVIGVVVG